CVILAVFREFPAPAGINRRRVQQGSVVRRVPRASGDKPELTDRERAVWGGCAPQRVDIGGRRII
ncbi:hypothetical protein, partial [Escherichia coli]|uniref:hypothetical protein n=1 Tax=Escherichia coli TaxID=562 RepID=UPI001BDC074D